MNQDFALLLTPANARRLMRVQQFSAVDLPERLIDIALQDMIGEESFDSFVCPYDTVKCEITQFILDNGLRAIVQQNYHPGFDQISVVNAVRLGNPGCVTVFTENGKPWRNAANALFIGDRTRTCRFGDLTNEEIDARKGGVLIVDGLPTGVPPNYLQGFASEFPRTIFFQGEIGWEHVVPWPFLARMLFASMPNPLFPRIVHNVPTAYKQRPLHKVAPLYATCIFPDLIDDRNILERLSDNYLNLRLQSYRNI